MLERLVDKLEEQAQDGVEILTFVDNMKRTIGEKRDNLLKLAKGEYFAFVDDDDDISNDYINELLKATESGCDVLLFKSEADVDGEKGIIEFDLQNENEQFEANETTKRQPFHINAWKTSKFRFFTFPNLMYGEDWLWAKEALTVAETQHKIDKVLHYYNFSSKITRAV